VDEPEAPTVVYFHGNGEVVADYLPNFPDWLGSAGYNVLLAEYRGYGMSEGTPAIVSMLDDVLPIIDSLKVEDRRVVLFGRSIGSLFAVHGVSKRPQIGGLIIESGLADLTDKFRERIAPRELGVSESEIVIELRKHFDYAAKLRGFHGKTLILHTRHDDLVPVSHAEMLYAAAPEPKHLKIFDHGGHNDIFAVNENDYMKLIEEFLSSAFH
jgi:pimeloyl-ACP methyl ester carboxylesterase